MKKIERMDNYWTNQSKNYLHTDELGLGAVLYSGMPLWFNTFFNLYQVKAFNDLIADINLEGKKVLDAGCGVGRWSYFLKQKQAKVVGVDFEADRLEIAKNNSILNGIDFEQMSLTDLKYKDSSFDFVNSITVLQHIPYNEKPKAIDEISRVTKKDGFILLVELIDIFDDAPHVFPLKPNQWIKEFESRGLKLVKTVGNEYSFPLRFLRYLRFLISRKKTISKETGQVKLSNPEWMILKSIITLSYPLEELSIKILPPYLARHGGFLFQKY